MSYTEITGCRACGQPLLDILNLGMQKMTGWLDKPTQEWPEGPLDLVICEDKEVCGLVQLRHSIDPDLMFKDQDYGYLSGTNEIMKEALDDVVWESQKRKPDPKVFVDIGANDGTLLSCVQSSGLPATTIGYEPVHKLGSYGRNFDYWISDYFRAETYPENMPGADIITACAMFYDLEDPVAFCKDVKAVLSPDGIFTIQLSYLPFMLALTDYPGICHEHLEYYSLKSLEYVLNQAGLHVFDLEINETNGGSLRVYVDHGIRAPSFMVYNLQEWERQILYQGKDSPYDSFEYQSRTRIAQLSKLVRELNAVGKTVAAFTASTKGNTIIQSCGFTSDDLAFAVERNPAKVGKYCAGSGIPIIGEEEARERNPDFYVVFPWYFMSSFRNREREWHDRGGRWIIPLPEVSIE